MFALTYKGIETTVETTTILLGSKKRRTLQFSIIFTLWKMLQGVIRGYKGCFRV